MSLTALGLRLTCASALANGVQHPRSHGLCLYLHHHDVLAFCAETASRRMRVQLGREVCLCSGHGVPAQDKKELSM